MELHKQFIVVNPMSTLSNTQRVAKRKARMISICLECRRRKIKCDKSYPCSNCSKFSRECLFLAPAMEIMARQRAEATNRTKSDKAAIDQLLDQVIAVPRSSNTDTNSPSLHHIDDTELQSSQSPEAIVTIEHEEYLEPTAAGAISISYGDDAQDPELDLGINIGKMWMTDRIGGLLRPHMPQEIDRVLSNPLFDRRTEAEKAALPVQLADEGRDFLGPRCGYLEPNLLSSDRSPESVGVGSFMEALPDKSSADTLVNRYHEAVHAITPIMHWPTFQYQYGVFWRVISSGLEPARGITALMFSVFFAASASMVAESLETQDSQSKLLCRNTLQDATEVALRNAKVLHGSRLEILQALVIYLLPSYGYQISKAHTALLGMAITIAGSLGLHRDLASTANSQETERHVRRLIWFHLSSLELRVYNAHGARMRITGEEYDTKMPLNVDEVGYGRATAQDGYGWSAMTFARVRFECVEMSKRVWRDRVKVQTKEITIMHCLGKIESFRKTMEWEYGRHLDQRKPIQQYTRLVMDLLIQNLYIMILFRYLRQYGQKVPDRLRQLTIHAAVVSMEAAMTIETSPELSMWKWHNGSYQQWQIGFLLLSHIIRTPDQPQATRIWRIIDYVFEIEASLSPAVKIRTILTTIRNRTQMYHDRRRIRTLTDFDEKYDLPQRVAAQPTSSLEKETRSKSTYSSNGISLITGHPGHQVPNDHEPQFTPDFHGDYSLMRVPYGNVTGSQDLAALPLHSLPSSDQSMLARQQRSSTLAERFPDDTTPDSYASWTDAWDKDLEMLDIDWNEWDQIFPQETHRGGF